MIYLDNGATTFPKPEVVYQAMDIFARTGAVNAGRGAYAAARAADQMIKNVRTGLISLMDAREQAQVVLTPSVTIALNQIIYGQVWTCLLYTSYPLVPEQDGAGRVVAVIGGGPAGMQSAVTLAKRGFDVTLFEKEDTLGGTMNLADKGPHKEKITRFVETMKAEVERAGVKVLLGKAPSIDEVKALAPEGVVMAAGAAPIVPRIPGVDKPHVCTAYDVISGDVKVSGKVALIGSGITGLECAEMMLNEGCQVAMVEMLDAVGTGMFSVIINDIMSRIKPKDPAMYLHTMLTEIGDGYVMVKDVKTGEEKRIEADHVVLSLGVVPRADVLAEYRSAFKNVICVGDNAQRGRIPHATKEGYIKSLVFLKD